MKIITEINSIANFEAWSGGKDTLNGIIDLGGEYVDRLDELAEMTFQGECTDTELNDWLWFDRDSIYDYLGFDENGNIPDDEDEDEELLDGVDEDSIRSWIEDTAIIAVQEKDYSKVYYYNITEEECIMLSWEGGYDTGDGYALEFSVRKRNSSYMVYDWDYVPYYHCNSEVVYEFPENEEEEEFTDTDDLITWITDTLNIII